MARLRVPAPRRLAAGILALALCGPPFAPAARASSPWDAELDRLAEQAARDGRRPEGMLPLLELWADSSLGDAEASHARLEALARDRRLDAPRRAYVEALLARSELGRGARDAARARLARLGYLTAFRVIGPFDNEGKAGFDAVLPPEEARLAPFDPEVAYDGKERPVRWRAFPEESTDVAYVDFDAIYRPQHNVCAFAETFVVSERAQPLSLWVGNGGAFKLWWNGAEVARDARTLRPDPDRHAVRVDARRGANRLLVKLCATDGTWGFFLRAAAADGGPPSRLRAVPTPEPFPELAPAEAPRNGGPVAPLAALEARAAAPGARAADHEALARFLLWTDADDPAERPARNHARRAAELEPTVERHLLAAELAENRGERMAAVAAAAALAPERPEVLLALADLRRSGPSPEQALPLLDRVGDEGRFGMRAASARAAVWGDLGLVEAAHAEVARVAARAEDAPGWIARHLEVAEASGRTELAHTLRERWVASQWNAYGPRRVLVADALARRDREAARRHLDVARALSGWSAARLRWIAAMEEALGDGEAALEVLAQARALAPEDASTLVAHGELLLRLDQRELAAELLAEALELRPQDAATRELLEQIRPETRFDEAYAFPLEELLARRGEPDGFPETILQELTVNTVFDNGLGSSFRQVAVQLHDDEGTRRWRTYSIQFDPDSQRVDVRQARVVKRDGRVLEATQTFVQQLGEPWYRIYYDTRALVVVFPDLEPGDVVEIRYRIDDVSHRNLFADYYGDLHFLQGYSPIARLDYVLVTPAARSFHVNDPGLADLERTRRVEGTRAVDHFVRRDVPAIRAEQGMPGMTEVAPYLHVSTYRTWDEVGRWWWGLVKDQLEPDQALRDTVAALVADADDVPTKVRRVHGWVLENTRYVGLEFGIHGFKPYRVPLVVQRGFGDCKDKASLLYAMLELAGVDARLVLVRTRRNGAIDDLPASLAVFDHAIAYVPELDLWLDGTAEHSGTTELPTMDQGVTVLVVGPDGAELRRTPVTGPDRDRRARRLEVALAKDGAAEVDVEEEIRGVEAAGYRRDYEAEGTREERLERALRSLFPGLVLESQTIAGLEDREGPVTVRYTARVPQLAQRQGDTLTVPLAAPSDLVRALARTPTRRYPLDLGTPATYVEERRLSPPPGHRVGRLPTGGEARSDFGHLTLGVREDQGDVVARTELVIAADRVAPERYPAFRAWVESMDRLLAQRLELVEDVDR